MSQWDTWFYHELLNQSGPGSWDYRYTRYRGNRSQKAEETVAFIRSDAMFHPEVSNNGTHIYWLFGRTSVRAMTLQNASEKSSYAIVVRTGQPGAYYTPGAVEKILAKVPGGEKWYAVFSDPLAGGGYTQLVIHAGKLYQTSKLD